MAVSIDQFGKALVASGLMTADDVKALWSAIPAEGRPKDGDKFAQLLVDSKKLTPFQAKELLAGRGARLIMGDYTVLTEIGAGGMGQVYKAQHRRMNRTVALKVMSNAAMSDAAAVKRFQREVHAAAKLEHPNIVTAYDSGEAGSVKYLVMQFVDGGDLSDLVKKQGPLGIQQAVGYVIQAARGLAFAHGEGVIHRDIKPANLLLDKKGVVKILDMGLARFEDGGDGLTATEQVMGTVDYMSPEQAANTKTADGRADIYSLGCTLWFLLTGKKTYEGDTMIGRLMAHRDAPLPSLVKVRDDAPWPLEQAFHKMIAKRAEDRFQSMNDVVVALGPFGGESMSGTSTGAASSSGGPSADLASFMQSMGTGGTKSSTSATQVKPATSVNIDATAQFSSPEVGTDPKSQILPPPKPAVAAAKPQATMKPGSKGKKPGNNRTKLIAVGAIGGVLLLAGIILKIRDKDGNVVAEVNAPTGATIEVVPKTLLPAGAASTLLPPGEGGRRPDEGRISPGLPLAQLFDSSDYVWTPPENLGPSINGPSDDFNPSLTADQSRIFYGRSGTGGWEAIRRSPAVPFETSFKSAGGGGDQLSADGLSLISSGRLGADVQHLELNMATRATLDSTWDWSNKTALFTKTVSAGDKRHPSLSPDGLAVIFAGYNPASASTRHDIWITRRSSTSALFEPPSKLGAAVNSNGDETVGMLLGDNRTIVFCREKVWYFTFKNASGIETALPLRNAPFSTTENDLWLTPDGRTAYYSADLPGGFGGKDIYVTRLVPKGGTTPNVPSFVATSVATSSSPATTIPAEALTFAGHRYLLGDLFCTWSEAKAHAEAMGGHLATINSKEERDWILNNVFRKRPKGTDPNSRGLFMRLGGMIDGSTGSWSWITGEPFDASLWLGPMPAVVKKCGLNWVADDKWSNVATDNPNGRSYYFLVEWDTLGPALVAASPAIPLAPIAAGPTAVRWPLAPSKSEDIAWLQSLKAKLTLRDGNSRGDLTVLATQPPPAGAWTIVGIECARENGPEITDQVLQRIAGLGDLESLTLNFAEPGSVATQEGLKPLAALANLRKLALGRIGTTGTDPEFLRSFRSLESLELSNAPFSGWEPHVSRMSNLSELKLYNLDNAKLEQLGPLPRLTSLRFAGYATGEAIRLATAKRFMPVVPWCRITYVGVNGDNGKELVVEPTAPPPTVVGVASTSPAGAESQAAVAAWLLENKKLAKIGFEVDGRRQNMTTVPTGPFKVVELNFSRFNNAGQPLTEQEVSRLAVFTDLESLELPLTDAGLAKLVSLKKLKSLIVAGSELTPAAVATIRQFPQLEHLHAFGSDEWLKPLAGMPTLRSMVFWKVKVSPEAMSWFAQYPNLKELTFHECIEAEKDPKSFVAIEPLKDCKSLSKLTLAGSAIDAADLAVLSGFTQLLELNLNVSTRTEAEVRQLAVALPRCKITWTDAANKKTIIEPTAPPEKTSTAAPAFEQWLKETAAKPAEEQLAAVSQKLMELNPGFDGKLTDPKRKSPPIVEAGVVTRLGLNGPTILDISPLRALTGLKELGFGGSGAVNGKLTDLSPLAGLPLVDLNLSGMGHLITDLSPLAGMRLERLICRDLYQLTDVTVLAGMPLQLLDLNNTRVANLATLKGMPLETLVLPMTALDLSPLQGMKLVRLECGEVADLSLLRGMPLKTFWCFAGRVADYTPLYECKDLTELRFINATITPAAAEALQKGLPNCKIEWLKR